MSDANGGIVTVSSISSATNYQPTYMINGDRAGQAAHYWQDATNNTYPDWVEVTFASEVEINEVDLFSVQDTPSSPVEPTEAMTFNNYGVSAYDVQYWDAATSSWTTVAGVSGNNKVWSKLTFSAVKTTRIRINITNAKGGYSRIAELEVYTPAGGATQRFDAWGNKIASTGTIPQYGYTGRELDETGLVYYRARYYDPTIGRFTQRDPIGLMGGVNQYAYVQGNPVNYTDPEGLWVSTAVGALNGAVSGFMTGAMDGNIKAGVVGGVAGAVIGGIVGTFAPGASGSAAAAVVRSALVGAVGGGGGSAIGALSANGDVKGATGSGTLFGAIAGLASGVAGTAVKESMGIAVKTQAGKVAQSLYEGSVGRLTDVVTGTVKAVNQSYNSSISVIAPKNETARPTNQNLHGVQVVEPKPVYSGGTSSSTDHRKIK